ncbi:MAG: hypothetical protein PVI03_00455, partial [Candidatus Thorarchaeota archaeon]
MTKATKHLYWGGKGRKGIRRILREALAEYRRSVKERKPDAKHLQAIENNVRRSYNKLLLNIAVPYGNVEEKRRRRKEDRKYINILADYYGAKIRNLGASRFPFPKPMRRKTKDGKAKWVYQGNSRTPEYVLTHTAPELDFVDMIRSHGIELARQCMKYSVPMRDAKRYLDGLIERLVPYLEYVYTERKRGKKGFIHGGSRELREVVQEIQAVYGGVNGRPPSITAEISDGIADIVANAHLTLNSPASDEPDQVDLLLDDSPREDDVLDPDDTSDDELDTFFSDIADKCEVDLNPEWKPHVERVQSLISEGILTRADSEYVLQKLREDARMMGSAFHDFIANSEFSVRPFSMFTPIRHGDEMVTEKSPFLFTCEVTVANGRGRVDILVFRRKNLERADESRQDTVWEPCILLEIKTKCFYSLDLYATRTKSQDKSRRVMEPIIERRRSDDAEWEEVINSTPDDYGKEQLEAYEKAVLSAYRKFARTDSNPPSKLMKGVLVVDLKENWDVLRDSIRDLVLEAYHTFQEDSYSRRRFFYPILGDNEPRMGLVAYSNCETRDAVSVEKVHEFDSFQHSRLRNDDREFVLYLTVLGKGSPAASAAGIAARWHGLNYIYNRVKGKHRDIVWFDLAGELRSREFREQHLRTGLHSRSVRRFLRERIAFADISESFTSYVNGMISLDSIIRELAAYLDKKRRPLVVVTGMNRLRSIVPRKKTPIIEEFLSSFLERMPSQSTVLWFDRPVPVSQTSQTYDTRCVAPFYPISPWMHVIDEIVYNVPMAPRRYGSYVPVEDDIRWLVIERIDNISIDPVLIPPLFKWGERFRPDSNREKNIDRQQEFYLRSNYASIRQGYRSHYSDEDCNVVLELIPHLSRFYQKLKPEEKDITFQQRALPKAVSNSPSLLSRVVFRPYQYLTSADVDNRIKILEPLMVINHAREYRNTRLYETSPKQTTRPPHVGLLHFSNFDRLAIARRELSGIRCISKIIANRHGEKKGWTEFLEALSSLIDRKAINGNSQGNLFNNLRDIRVFLEAHDLSKSLWAALRKHRAWIPYSVLEEQKLELKKLLDKEPDLLLIIGNHLFLLLLVSLYESGALDAPTRLQEILWDYLMPFQMMGIGFIPRYHSHHNTGESFLHRTKLIDRLKVRAKGLKQILGNGQVSEARFGRAYLVEGSNKRSSQHLLLTFQARPGSHETNVIFLKLPLEASESTLDVLKGLCEDRPFWGISDLALLTNLSERVNPEKGLDVMVATQRGIRGLWACDDRSSTWLPMGSIDYHTRRHETVTLVMSVTLRENPTLLQLTRDTVRKPPSHLEDSISVGLGLISAVFRNITPAKCHVHLDTESQKFRLSVLDPETEDELAHLETEKTADVLEVLRRPDFSCEPVVVNGKHYAWNRFTDVEFHEEVKALRPFVLRRDPFKIDSVLLPPKAESFQDIGKGGLLRVRVSHDYHVCPLRSRNPESISKQSMTVKGITEHLQDVEGDPGQPESLFNESIYRHGACWRIAFHPD